VSIDLCAESIPIPFPSQSLSLVSCRSRFLEYIKKIDFELIVSRAYTTCL
jgi:hypothetical protein